MAAGGEGKQVSNLRSMLLKQLIGSHVKLIQRIASFFI